MQGLIPIAKKDFLVILFFMILSIFTHLKIFVNYDFIRHFEVAVLWIIVTSNTPKINIITIILCAIMQDLFDCNDFMISSIIYMIFYGIQKLKNLIMINNENALLLIYNGILLFLLIISKDILIAVFQDQTFYGMNSLSSSLAALCLYFPLYMFFNFYKTA